MVVGLAGQELENIYDYVRALNGLKPGENGRHHRRAQGRAQDLLHRTGRAELTPFAANRSRFLLELIEVNAILVGICFHLDTGRFRPGVRSQPSQR